MSRRIAVFLVVLFLISTLTSQPFIRHLGMYGGGLSINETEDGSYIILGSGDGFTLVKTDLNGDPIWTNSLGIDSRC